MAWPTTPATTTHLDAGTDDPGLARPQIKQNVDNVNAIIDEFGDVNITSPTDGQLLQYNASNSRWENADASTGGGGGDSNMIVLGFNGTNALSDEGAPDRYYYFTELVDGGDNATINSDGELLLATGTYLLMDATIFGDGGNYDSRPEFYNENTNTQIANTTESSTNNWEFPELVKFSVTSTGHRHILRYDSSVTNTPITNITDDVIILLKIS